MKTRRKTSSAPHALSKRWTPLPWCYSYGQSSASTSEAVVSQDAVRSFERIVQVAIETDDSSGLGKFKEIENEIVGYSEMPAGWDSYNSKKVSFKAIELATMLAGFIFQEFKLIPVPAPMSSGGVSLEYVSEHIELEFEIFDRSNVTVSLLNTQTDELIEYTKPILDVFDEPRVYEFLSNDN